MAEWERSRKGPGYRRRYFIISELDPEKAVESTMGRVIGEAFYPFGY
jgi:hypothetical protein